MKSINLLIIFFPFCLLAQNEIEISWGTNIIGNSVELSYSRGLTDRLFIGLSYQSGFISYDLKKGSDNAINVTNSTERTIYIDILTKAMIDIIFKYQRKTTPGIKGFSNFGLGLTYYSVLLEEKTCPIWSFSNYKGSKNYKGLAILLNGTIIKYSFYKFSKLSVFMGAKCRLFWIKTPQTISLINENSPYDSIEERLISDSDQKEYLFLIIPELTLGIKYNF